MLKEHVLQGYKLRIIIIIVITITINFVRIDRDEPVGEGEGNRVVFFQPIVEIPNLILPQMAGSPKKKT
jgi:hypothetical protein